ncbi:unnamed protein product [Candida verbasci]|uniref:Uncharacterized protein n=1 Tax=Candida verbasci TaxID=1227364 RepID=A0A9W4TYA6_9ASCO|nr:unnamed protein product [Candida verbasci]
MGTQNTDFNTRNIDSSNELDYVNYRGSSRKHILDAVEASTKRLDTFVDVLQILKLDKSVPEVEYCRTKSSH